MSVLKNNRTKSELEFYHTATVIRNELTKFVMNEKNIPKRWRPIFTFPMVEKVIALIDNIVAANSIYPVDKHEVMMRRDYQTQAIIIVEQILQLLQFLLSTLEINPDKLQPVVELLIKESSLLRGWRKSDNAKFKDKFIESKS